MSESKLPPRPRRILIVEDNRGVADITKRLLVRCGHDVVGIACNGQAAIEAVTTERPDVALIDLGLPDMDGYELAARLRSLTTNDDLRLIAVTADWEDEARRRSAAAGFDLHLVKPVSIDTLRRVIAESPLRSSVAEDD